MWRSSGAQFLTLFAQIIWIFLKLLQSYHWDAESVVIAVVTAAASITAQSPFGMKSYGFLGKIYGWLDDRRVGGRREDESMD